MLGDGLFQSNPAIKAEEPDTKTEVEALLEHQKQLEKALNTAQQKEAINTAKALFAKAQSKADAASVYGKRIALIDDFLKGLRSKSQQLGKIRGPVPVLRLVGDARERDERSPAARDPATIGAPRGEC